MKLWASLGERQSDARLEAADTQTRDPAEVDHGGQRRWRSEPQNSQPDKEEGKQRMSSPGRRRHARQGWGRSEAARRAGTCTLGRARRRSTKRVALLASEARGAAVKSEEDVSGSRTGSEAAGVP
jgi:hypothetical protein